MGVYRSLYRPNVARRCWPIVILLIGPTLHQHVGSMLGQRTTFFIDMLAERGTKAIFTQKHEAHVRLTAYVLYIWIWFPINLAF